ncbi:MAG: peptide chain release factor N(5)-glutamine methyltransferase [Acidiferrobacterales bacterium]
MSLGQYLSHASAELAAQSLSARTDVEALTMHVCGLDRAGLVARSRDALDAEQIRYLDALVRRRASGEPIAYLTGRREFWSLDLKVTSQTLIPRPETELLVELALARIPHEAAWNIADLGTGSGAVALALAHERPRCRLVATDVSPAAISVARDNACNLGFTQVSFREGHWLAALAGERFELLVSNPPYIRDGDPHLDAGDVRFEPGIALRAGSDGLTAIREIAAGAQEYLEPGAWLLLEHGYDQGHVVREILVQDGYLDCTSFKDLAGHTRVSAGRRPGGA